MRPAIRFASAVLAFAALAGAASASPASRFPGTYVTTRPGAQSTQELVLVLALDGRATLTTGFPDLVHRYGSAVLPVRETGTWSERGREVEVRLTAIGLLRHDTIVRLRHENKVMALLLMTCRLSAVRYSKELYGDAGLTFEKSGCNR